MKHLIIAAAAAIMTAASASAYVETREVMVVTLADGSKSILDVDKVKDVSFATVNDTTSMTVTSPAGDVALYTQIPQLFRVVGVEDGDPTRFGFGPVAAVNPDDLTAGRYAVELTLSPSTLYQANLNLEELKESVLVTLYTYDEEGAVEATLDEYTSGTLTTSLNPRTREVTLNLDVTFTDGTVLFADYAGTATDVESLEALNPAPVYINELVYFNKDGEQTIHRNVTGVTRDSYHGQPRFTFSFDNDTEDTWLVMAESLIGKEVLFDEVEKVTGASTDPYVIFNYGSMQVASANECYRNTATNARATVVDNGDGTWTFDIDATNTYFTPFNQSEPMGTPERVVINFSGAVTNK